MCQTCPAGCSSCLSELTCLACSEGYRMDDSAGLCVNCIEHCKKCSRDSACEVCFSNYVRDPLTQTCQRIDSGKHPDTRKSPYSRNNSVIVSTAKPSDLVHALNTTATPNSIAIANCKILDGSGKCFFCELGYFIAGNGCRQCASGCLSCSDPFNCRRCRPGFRPRFEGNRMLCESNRVRSGFCNRRFPIKNPNGFAKSATARI